MAEITTDKVWEIAKEAIADHAKTSAEKQEISNKNLDDRFSQIHNDLKEIKLDLKEGNSLKLEMMRHDNRIHKLEEWQEEVKDKPKKQLDSMSKVIGIIATILSILSGTTMVFVYKALVKLGG